MTGPGTIWTDIYWAFSRTEGKVRNKSISSGYRGLLCVFPLPEHVGFPNGEPKLSSPFMESRRLDQNTEAGI